MYISDVVGSLIGFFIEWGFLMVFFCNLVIYINKLDKCFVILVFIMMVLYFLSGIFNFLVYSYMNWFYFDLFIIIVIFFWGYFVKISFFCVFYYVILGLFLNFFLMFLIYVDIVFFENWILWGFWSIYFFGVNIIDIIMIIVLIINCDFLFIFKLGKVIESKVIFFFKEFLKSGVNVL